MEHARSTEATLPASIQSLFWEHEADALTWENDRAFIIRRVLAEGDWNAVAWLRSRLGDAALRDWMVEHDAAGLSPRQLRFWQLVLDLPAPIVDDWVAARRDTLWQQRSAA